MFDEVVIPTLSKWSYPDYGRPKQGHYEGQRMEEHMCGKPIRHCRRALRGGVEEQQRHRQIQIEAGQYRSAPVINKGILRQAAPRNRRQHNRNSEYYKLRPRAQFLPFSSCNDFTVLTSLFRLNI